ncbi:hypothetical protein [Mycobacterium riyadhense]|nr:hypothetical protein [Mycobacterium riyadhense]
MNRATLHLQRWCSPAASTHTCAVAGALVAEYLAHSTSGDAG